METLKSIKLPGNRLFKICQDDNSDSPREWDNVGTMICFHTRYNLGDKHSLSLEEAQELISKKGVYSLPLYLYDHSGITMSTGRAYPFNCQWDSGQVGWIYVTKEKIKKEKWEKKTKEEILKYLEGEVETYDQYLTGDIYGFVLEKTSPDCKHPGSCSCHDSTEDSCWGFYGRDWKNNGILDNLDDADKKIVLEQLSD